MRAGMSPKIVQRVMRHSSIQLTLDVYGHLLKSEEAEAGGKMQSLMQQVTANVTQDACESLPPSATTCEENPEESEKPLRTKGASRIASTFASGRRANDSEEAAIPGLLPGKVGERPRGSPATSRSISSDSAALDSCRRVRALRTCQASR